MKKIDTAYICNEKADFKKIKEIIENLYDDEISDEWLCLFDTSKKNPNYIQVTVDYEDYDEDISYFWIEALKYSQEKIDAITQIYLVEYRKYDGEKFQHCRTFIDDVNIVISLFEKYINDDFDNIIPSTRWIDVTEEFL